MVEVVSAFGWDRCLQITTDEIELLISLDVGPRVLRYARRGGTSPFALMPDQLGQMGEAAWRLRGGHRLWVAPENREVTYHPDNGPIEWGKIGSHSIRLLPEPEVATGFQKELIVTVDARGTGVEVCHRLTRTGATKTRAALWGLSVMVPGGMALVPQAPRGEHPRDLLPDRRWILWPYTDLSDPRWSFGPRFIRLQQSAGGQPTKLGLRHDMNWAAYWAGRNMFLKFFRRDPAAEYPDDGCNIELFTNRRMLELESLGPLVELAPGTSLEHVERWELHDASVLPVGASDEALVEYFRGINPELLDS